MREAGNQIVSESDIIQGCREGDRRMQRLLYERFSPTMYGICLRYAGTTEEAEDVLQEGFIKVFSKIDSFRGDGSFEGWMRRIFVNTAIEHYRKKTYLQPIGDQQENTMEGKYLTALDHMAEKDIVALVQQLAPGYRLVFNMYVVEGYTHKQIADELNISEGTSKSQLSRARVLLQDLVRKNLGERQPPKS